MDRLNDFIHILEGRFDNSEQFEHLRKQGDSSFPYAKHINTPCNHKIILLTTGVDLELSSYSLGNFNT